MTTTTNETFLSGGQRVTLEIFLPATSGKHPAMLILHGSSGLQPQYRADIVSFARAFTEAGIAAAMPHYLESTHTDPGKDDVTKLILENRPTWRQACSDALALMANDGRFDVTRLGILGFSLGGNLALSLAMDPPSGTRLKCVVDFFGLTRFLENHWAKLPPILVCHGTKDEVVYPAESTYLETELKKVKKKDGSDYIFKWYKDEGHGFKDPALTQSRIETVSFLKKTL